MRIVKMVIVMAVLFVVPKLFAGDKVKADSTVAKKDSTIAKSPKVDKSDPKTDSTVKELKARAQGIDLKKETAENKTKREKFESSAQLIQDDERKRGDDAILRLQKMMELRRLSEQKNTTQGALLDSLK